MQEYLSVSEAVTCLGYTSRRVRQLAEEGSLKAMKMGRGWRIPVSEVNRRLEPSPEPPNPIAGERISAEQSQEGPVRQESRYLLVSVETSSQGHQLLSHPYASSLEPFGVFFSVACRGEEVIRYLRLHVWLFSSYVFWYPGHVITADWSDEGHSELPEELKSFRNEVYGAKAYYRWTLSRSPEDGFFLMPSSQKYSLPFLYLSCRNFVGMLPIPWQVECPGLPPVSGALLFWCDKDGVFNSESVGPDVDMNDLTRRQERFLIKNGVTQMPRWQPSLDL